MQMPASIDAPLSEGRVSPRSAGETPGPPDATAAWRKAFDNHAFRRAGDAGRKALGLSLLGLVVFLWTASSFLASVGQIFTWLFEEAVLADDSYDKPFFIIYLNTSFFIIPLVPPFLRHLYRTPPRQWSASMFKSQGKVRTSSTGSSARYQPLDNDHAPSSSGEHSDAIELLSDPCGVKHGLGISADESATDPLTMRETAQLGFRIAFLWFIANYFNNACLAYTTVASATILSSTSSITTLLFGALFKVEKFSLRKLIGVLASLMGIAIISLVDSGGDENKDRGSFPHKTAAELFLGDAMALVAAVLYGLYAVGLVKTVGDEKRVNMPIFFGFIGLVNCLCLWPVFVVLHFWGIETFHLPPTARIAYIVLINAGASLIADICWAYAMLLTSPLVVTVGLSLTIPLSLVGQMVLDQQYEGFLYWLGALVVVLSFVFISLESERPVASVDPPMEGQ